MVGGRGFDYARAGCGGRGGGCCAAAADRVPGRVICLSASSRGCAIRAGGRGADEDRLGGFAGGVVRGEGVPSWSRRPVRRAGLRGDRSRRCWAVCCAVMGGAGRGIVKIRGDVCRGPGRTRRPPRDAATPTPRAAATAHARPFPGWPYSFAAGLEWGATSWTALLDAVRTGPQDSASTVTAAQVGRVHRRLAAAGLRAARPRSSSSTPATTSPALPISPATTACRSRCWDGSAATGSSTGPLPSVPTTARAGPRGGTGRVSLWPNPPGLPVPDQQAEAGSARYGLVRVSAWHELHQQLSRGGGWSGHAGELPIVPGTVIRLQVRRPARQPHPQRPVAMAPRPARRPLRSGPAVEDLPSTLRS